MDPINKDGNAGAPAATVVPTVGNPSNTNDEVAKLRKQLEQAEHVIVGLKKKSDEAPSTDALKEEAAKIAQAEIEKVRNDLAGDVLEEEISKVAKTPEEKEAVLKEYNSSIVKTGVSRAKIAADLSKAAAIANLPKVQAQAAEARAAAASAGAARTAAPAGVTEVKTDSIKLSAAEEKWAAETAARLGKKVEEVKAQLAKNRKS
jgi:hypothetical protein